jgi:hypothetical protein
VILAEDSADQRAQVRTVPGMKDAECALVAPKELPDERFV